MPNNKVEQPDDQTLALCRRRFASEANNRAWELSERAELTASEQEEILHAAHVAAEHWSKVGGEREMAHARLLLGRVYSLLGHGALAVEYATSAHAFLTTADSAPWELAFAHAILANAAAVAGKETLHQRHYAQAKNLGETLDGEDRELFLATFERIPAP